MMMISVVPGGSVRSGQGQQGRRQRRPGHERGVRRRRRRQKAAERRADVDAEVAMFHISGATHPAPHRACTSPAAAAAVAAEAVVHGIALCLREHCNNRH